MMILRLLFRARSVLALMLALAPAVGHAATFTGEFWNASSSFNNINQATNFAAANATTATFQSTGIDYPNGATTTASSSTTLASFLGVDAASIVGDGNATIETSVFRFTGFVDLLPGAQQFNVRSDDGFRLTINGTRILQQNRPRSFSSSVRNRNPGEGRATFELLFYENFGNSGLEVLIDGAIVTAAPIPLPPGFPLIVAALAALGLLKWGKRTTLPLVNAA